MPVYEYLCDTCGGFDALRPMARASEPHACPDCGEDAPRAMLSAPAFSGMSSATRTAHAINERSAHAPKESGKLEPTHRHGPGCGCGSASAKATRTHADGAKSFPSKRPWMISH
ncbi:MAG: zinc ribbon domain-containing protein [Burkholderiales bacterium]|nr:zinc ribbon domain-containing protein [Burkholderiales bacterium]